jgi:hypothetical protein
MSSGWLHRVIGKIAGSDFGRKLIGKTDPAILPITR